MKKFPTAQIIVLEANVSAAKKLYGKKKSSNKKVPTAKCSYIEITSQQIVLPAKSLYGIASLRKKILRRNVTQCMFLQWKI